MNKPKGTRVRKYPKLEQFWRNVEYFRSQNDLTAAQMAKVLSISKATYTTRRSKPEATTGKEITLAAKFFGVEEEQMLLPLIGVNVQPYEVAAYEE